MSFVMHLLIDLIRQIVLSTWQMMHTVATELPASMFANLICDEADYGLCRSARSTATSWCEALNHFRHARVLMLSGTCHRRDNIPLPTPFYRYTYNDALADRVVKRVHFLLLQPARALS